MNPWRELRKLMDAVPEANRRLARHDAWRPDLGCGCVFGTLFPGTPRDESSRINFATAIKRGEEPERQLPPHDYPWVIEPFTAWAHSLGLTQQEVFDLQKYNDHCPATHSRTEPIWDMRWRLVYAYVTQKEKKHDRDFPQPMGAPAR